MFTRLKIASKITRDKHLLLLFHVPYFRINCNNKEDDSVAFPYICQCIEVIFLSLTQNTAIHLVILYLVSRTIRSNRTLVFVGCGQLREELRRVYTGKCLCSGSVK